MILGLDRVFCVIEYRLLIKTSPYQETTTPALTKFPKLNKLMFLIKYKSFKKTKDRLREKIKNKLLYVTKIENPIKNSRFKKNQVQKREVVGRHLYQQKI